jgi:hypothetical protein
MQDGKSDVSGLWLPGPGYVGNIAKDIKPEDIPYQPGAAELFKSRRASNSKDDPTAQCIVAGFRDPTLSLTRSKSFSFPMKL